MHFGLIDEALPPGHDIWPHVVPSCLLPHVPPGAHWSQTPLQAVLQQIRMGLPEPLTVCAQWALPHSLSPAHVSPRLAFIAHMPVLQ